MNRRRKKQTRPDVEFTATNKKNIANMERKAIDIGDS